MRKHAVAILDFLLFSNIFIGVCAAAQGLLTYKLIGAHASYLVLGLLFLSTLCVYNFSILLSKPQNPDASPFRRVRWIFSHYNLMLILTCGSAIALIPLFFAISLRAEVLLFFMGIAAFGYALPIFTKNKQKFGFRNIPGLKLFLIAFVWSISCVLLPILEAESTKSVTVSLSDTLILISKRFLFIAAITIPFDIRDLYADNQANLKTLPVLWGERKAYIFCQLLLVIYMVLLFFFRHNGFDSQFWALLVTIIITGWLIFKAGIKKNEYYYFFYLDGTMLLQLIALISCEKLMTVLS